MGVDIKAIHYIRHINAFSKVKLEDRFELPVPLPMASMAGCRQAFERDTDPCLIRWIRGSSGRNSANRAAHGPAYLGAGLSDAQLVQRGLLNVEVTGPAAARSAHGSACGRARASKPLGHALGPRSGGTVPAC